MEKKEKFSGFIVVGALCCMLVFTAIPTINIVCMVSFAEKFSCSVTDIVAGTSVFTGVAFLSQWFAGRIISKITPKGAFFLSTLFILLFMLTLAFAPNFYVYWIGMGFGGLIMGFGQVLTASIVVRNWFHKKEGTIMGVILGFQSVGPAIIAAVASALLSFMDVSDMILIMTPFVVIPLIIINALFIKNEPGSLNQKPYGYKEESSADTQSKTAVNAGPTVPQISLFKSPVFWILVVGLLFQTIVMSSATLQSNFLQAGGLTPATAALFVSICGFVAAPAQIVNGWIRDKIGIKGFLLASYGLFLLGSIVALIWLNSAGVGILWIMIVLFGLSRGYLFLPAHVSGPVFGSQAANAQGKLQAVLSLGAMFLYPVVSLVAEGQSYTAVVWLWIIAAVLAVIVYLVALKIAAKRNDADLQKV
jgi:MFS family permease